MKKPSWQTLVKVVVAFLGVVLIGWLLYRAPFVRELVVSIAGQIGAPSVPYLRKVASQDDDHKVRQNAMLALRAIGADAVPSLTASLADADAEVRAEAARALCFIGQPAKESVPSLIEVLTNDVDTTARQEAARALGMVSMKSKDAVPCLLLALKDPEAVVRVQAATALGRIGTGVDVEEIVPALVAALQDQEADVRVEGAEGLERIGPRAKAAIPALTKALQDTDRRVRREAQEALESIQRTPPEPNRNKE